MDTASFFWRSVCFNIIITNIELQKFSLIIILNKIVTFSIFLWQVNKDNNNTW